ncbi:hypothetical protein DRO64_10965 [Candidatus Bathyarchaeota archaeon]|nr:MAG: hypothetical protein DRO64_10965 [Candidatus Bathyarchaeota archaeon]
MSSKDLINAYREALNEMLKRYKDVLAEWRSEFDKWKNRAKEEIRRGSIPPLPPIPKVPPISQLSGVRSNVVASRIRDEDLKVIDMLVEAGVFKTRSEAIAYLVSEGIKACRDIIDEVSSTLEEIRRIRRQAEEQIERLREKIRLPEVKAEAGGRICPSCNRDLSNLPEDIRVCPYCGARLSVD